MLTRVLDFFRAGSRDYNDAERRILASVSDALPPADKEIFARQIAATKLIQRQHPGRLVVTYYKEPDAVPVLPYSGIEHCLARVSYRCHGKTKSTFVVLHDGRFMSFERAVPQKSTDIEAVLAVDLHPNGYSGVADEIQHEEHGNVE